MSKKVIGKMLGRPVVVADNPNLVRPNEILAYTDTESDDIVNLQMRSTTTLKMHNIMKYVSDAFNVRSVLTDELPADSGSDASGGAVVGSPITVYIPNNAKKGYKPGLLQGKCYSSVGIDRSGSLPLLNVTANGTYEIDDDYLFGYTKVEVNVPTGSDAEVTYDAATESLSITGVNLTVG